MLLVTHDQAEATVMAGRIALMFAGCLRQVDTPEQLYRQPCDETVARFMGGVNFFSAEAEGRQWQLTEQLTLISEQAQYGAIQATIRPEQIQVFAEPRSGPNMISALVTATRFTGTQRRLTLALAANLTLQAWIAPTQDFAIGQSVWVHLPPAALWCFPEAAIVPRPAHVS